MKNEVRRWKRGEKDGTLVAGGNSRGNSQRQLSRPTGIVVDPFGQIYIGDHDNNRVMCWSQGDVGGCVVVVGGNQAREQSNQFNCPNGLLLDRKGNFYLADYGNHRGID